MTQDRESAPVTPIWDFVTFQQDSQNQNRRGITLRNGLTAHLCHDPLADDAQVQMVVSVGYCDDPDDMAGLAHLTEHLVFMGTKQFPEENAFTEYISRYNHSRNAWVEGTNTFFLFDVPTPALPGALARFAPFFHCPLFRTSSVSRELSSVDNEHLKNLQDDNCRLLQLKKHLCTSGHPWSKFGFGDRHSLTRAASRAMGAKGFATPSDGNLTVEPTASGMLFPTSHDGSDSDYFLDGHAVDEEIRRRMVDWFDVHYTANRMTLHMTSKASLNSMTALILPFFAPIRNHATSAPSIPNNHPFSPNGTTTCVAVQTVLHICVLEMSFSQPSGNDSCGEMGHFFAYQGPGSLYSYLKNKYYITTLNTGPESFFRKFVDFKITLTLSGKGFEQHHEVILVVFKYLDFLRASAKEWHENHPELRADTNKVVDALQGFKAERARIVLMARKEMFERIGYGSVERWQEEPIYGTAYKVHQYDDSDFVPGVIGCKNIFDFAVPVKPNFLPVPIRVNPHADEKYRIPPRYPRVIHLTPFSRHWHKKDDRFGVFLAQIIVDIQNPLASESARNCAMTSLFAGLARDFLIESVCYLFSNGLSFSLSEHTSGVRFIFHSSNSWLPIATQKLLEGFRTFKVDPKRLDVKKEELKRHWQNFSLGKPFDISDGLVRYLLSQEQWTPQEKVEAVSSITCDELQVFIGKLLSQIHLRTLIVGAIGRNEAFHLAAMTARILDALPLPSEDAGELELVSDSGCNHVWSNLVENPNEPSSSLTSYIHFGSATNPCLRVLGALLVRILSEPAFNVLRTKEQLGYVVRCDHWSFNGDATTGMRIGIQSVHYPTYLEERVEAFFVAMKTKLERLTEEEFDTYKFGLERTWMQAARNIPEETDRYWSQIENGHEDFRSRKIDVYALRRVTRSAIISFFDKKVHPLTRKSLKISVHLHSRKARMSSKALDAFKEFLRQQGLVGAYQWGEGSSVNDVIDSLPEGEDSPINVLLGHIPQLLTKYPFNEEGSLRSDTVVIEDPKLFKAMLRRSQPTVQGPEERSLKRKVENEDEERRMRRRIGK